MAATVYGDLACAVRALIAALFLYNRWSGALGVAWAINIVMSIDWMYGGYIAASRKLVTYPMGGNRYIINYYVPVIGGLVHVESCRVSGTVRKSSVTVQTSFLIRYVQPATLGF